MRAAMAALKTQATTRRGPPQRLQTKTSSPPPPARRLPGQGQRESRRAHRLRPQEVQCILAAEGFLQLPLPSQQRADAERHLAQQHLHLLVLRRRQPPQAWRVSLAPAGLLEDSFRRQHLGVRRQLEGAVASTSRQRVRLARGGGTRAARRRSNSRGVTTRWMEPSGAGRLSL